MPLPKVVIFDLGKVLVDFDYGIAARRIASRSKISAEAIKHFIDHSSLLFRYETGLMTKSQFYQEICAETGFCGGLDEFCRFFSDIFVPDQSMIAIQAELRQAGIPTYIFSNTNELAIEHVRRQYPFFSNFDGYILSFEHGAMKPDAKLYEVVERTSGHRGHDILYLDDRPENISAGEARGWQVILQESAPTSLSAIQKLGLLPNPHNIGQISLTPRL
jgi:FMN phosphatase YigB (HAD superfamily)